MNPCILSSSRGQRCLRAIIFSLLTSCYLGSTVEGKIPDQPLEGIFVSDVYDAVQVKIERRGGEYYYWDVPTDVACHTLGQPRRAKTVPRAELQKRLGDPAIQVQGVDLGPLGVLIHTPKNWELNSHFTTRTGYFLWDRDDSQSLESARPGDMEKLQSYGDVCPQGTAVKK